MGFEVSFSFWSSNATTILIFLLCLVVSRYLFQYIVTPNYPPGPRPWPVIGNLLDIVGTDPHKKLAKMADLYGGILMVHLGPMRTVVLSDLEAVKQALMRQANYFSDREQPKFIAEAFQTEGSVLWENGSVWKNHRRMIHSAFRRLGFQQKQFHSAITKEINSLCACLETKSRTNFDFRTLLTSATANVICTICFGQRYEYDDSEFSKAICAMLEISKKMSGISLAHLIPKLYHTPLYNRLRGNVNTLSGFIQENVQKHRATFDPNHIRDIVDVYLSNEMPHQDGDIVWRGLFDLFTAGSETLSDSLLWAILYLIIHPDIQQKVQQELDSVTADEMFQYPKSTRLLPFTYATLLEVHRHQSVAPLSVPRVTSESTTLLGYEVPKGTGVWVNEWAIHNDPDFWGDPEVFRPSRFLDLDGKTVLREKTQRLILFGYGLRQCLGKRLAEMENFMLFCGLFRRFTFSAPEGTRPTTSGHFGLTYSPLRFDVDWEVRSLSINDE